MKITDKKIISTVPIGGAPLFVDDIVRIQENASAEIYSIIEYYKKQIGGGWGFLITNPTIDASVIGATTIGEFYFYANEKIHYFSGGIFDLSINPCLYFYAENDVFEQRTFNDAGNKNLFVTNSVSYIAGNLVNPLTPVPVGREFVRVGYALLNQFSSIKNVALYPQFDDIFVLRSELTSALNSLAPQNSIRTLFGGAGYSNFTPAILSMNTESDGNTFFASKTGTAHVDFSCSMKIDAPLDDNIILFSIKLNGSPIANRRYIFDSSRYRHAGINYIFSVNQGDSIDVTIDFNNVGSFRHILDGIYTIQVR